MKIKLFCCISLIFLLVLPVLSQDQSLSKKEMKEMLIMAEEYYVEEQYISAAELLEKLHQEDPNDLYYKLMLGICYSYIQTKSTESLQLIKEVQKENPDYSIVYFHLGRALAVNYEFEKAIKNFEYFIENEVVTEEQLEDTKLLISNCENAQQLIKDTLEVEIANLGAPINTEYEEYVPIISPDERVLIYTYRGVKSTGGKLDAKGRPDPNGQYAEDVMISFKIGNEWTEPESIGENINTIQHDASIALSVSGDKLFIYKSTSSSKNGDIYLSTLENGIWSVPEKLSGEVNSDYWEGSVSMTADEKTLYFVSERPGGIGGRDIWKAERLPDGSWGNVKNLGKAINTKYDEDAPFIHPDGKTMYFSSKGHNSMGGYDIFYTYFSNNIWDKPGNVGYPVNTFYDDRYYVLSADGKKGYYSSAGVNSTMGRNDILKVEPGHLGKKPVVALIADVTNLDEKPSLYNISDSITEKAQYTLSITPGNRYRIAIEVEGDEESEKIEYINVGSYEAFIESEIDSNEFDIHPLQADTNVRLTETNDQEKPSQGSTNTYIQQYAKDDRLPTEKMNIEGLGFKLEVAATDDTTDLDLSYLSKHGPISKKTYPNGRTHYFFENFRTLEEVESFKRKLLAEHPEMLNDLVTVFVLEKPETPQQLEEFKEVPVQNLADTDCKKGGLDLFASFVLQKVSDEENYQRMLDSIGNYCSEGLTFEVQIAAYKKPENYKYTFLEGLGKVKIRDYPDEITRFTQGSYITFEDAEKLRQQIIAQGQEDAWITPFYNNKRLLMKELINGEFTQYNLEDAPANRTPIRTQELWF